MKFTASNIYYCILAFLFLQMLFLPKLYMGVKAVGIVIAIVLFLCLYKNHIRITNGKILIMIYLMLNITSTLIGMGKGYGAYAIRTGTVNIAWPACFLLLMDTRFGEKQLVWIYKAIIKITFILCTWDIAFMFCKSKFIYDLTVFLNRGIPRFSIINNWFLRVDHLYFYAFLTPFMLGVLLNYDKEFLRTIKMSKGFIGVSLFFSLLITVWSGMGGLWLASAAGAVICFFKFRLFRRKDIWILQVVSLFILLIFGIQSYSEKGIVYQIMGEISDKLIIIKDTTEWNNSVRVNQAKAMIDAWCRAPVFGQGVGYPVRYYRFGGYVVQAANELQYLTILYQRGVLGFLSFFALVGYAIHILNARKDIKWICLPFMVGMVSFLMANAFNPYLSNMSMMWILFFPFLIEK